MGQEREKQDKRKQRIVLTKKCDDFYKRNDQESANRINRMFEDIPEEQLITTIHTILQMERNLRKF